MTAKQWELGLFLCNESHDPPPPSGRPHYMYQPRRLLFLLGICIVKTDFRSFGKDGFHVPWKRSWSLFTLTFWSRRLPWKQSWPLFSLTFSFFLVQAASMHVKLAIVFTNFCLLLFGQAASVDAMLAIVFTDIFLLFLLVLACATRGGGRSEAGHCFHLLFSSFFLLFYAFSC